MTRSLTANKVLHPTVCLRSTTANRRLSLGVNPANLYDKTGSRQRIGSKQRKGFYEPLIAPSTGMLPRDLIGRTGTHRGLTD